MLVGERFMSEYRRDPEGTMRRKEECVAHILKQLERTMNTTPEGEVPGSIPWASDDSHDTKDPMSNEPLKEGLSDTKENPPPQKAYLDPIPNIGGERWPAEKYAAQVLAPPQFFDIPLGDPKDPVRASIPFGISDGDFDFLLKNLELWRERLTRQL